jgi:hypothetical protein
VCLKKAKAIAGLLGNRLLIDKFEEFDYLASIAIQALKDPSIKNLDNKQSAINNLKGKEKEIIQTFNQLL